VAANWRAVLERVRTAAARAGRSGASVEVVAVSKLQPTEAIRAAYAAGARAFGENYAQELRDKSALLADDRTLPTPPEWHFIGPLQSNKVRDAVALFDVIETVDRPRLAEALAAEMARGERRPDCFIQVNTGEEAQKAGIAPAEAPAFIARCRDELRLPVRGLMCIPPVDEAPSIHFAFLRDLARRSGLGLLSMGMSGDFESAIALGATHVRVGTAIFGVRPPNPSRGAG
jgi:pyridoxal phosphate enzyme (YggS family)